MTDTREESNAVVLCIMDTSGSMDTMKKYLARSFFFLLYQFISTRYQNVEIVFIAHHTEAKEVTEDEFFHKGESGGTFISSGYSKRSRSSRNATTRRSGTSTRSTAPTATTSTPTTRRRSKPPKNLPRSPICSATARSSRSAPATTAAA